MKLMYSLWHHKIRTLLAIAALIIVGLVIHTFTKPPQLTKTKVIRQDIAEFIEASGRIKAAQTVTLSLPVNTKLTWVGIKKGDQVKKNQVIASFDRRELEKSLKSKLLDYMDTRWQFEQTRDDYKDMALTDAEKRILERSQFGLDQAVLDYEIANLAMEQTWLASPIAGTVVDDADLVTGVRLAATDITTRQIKITDLKSLYYQAEVDEADYGKLKSGMKARISLDSFPEASFSGTIQFVGQEGIKKTGGGIQIPVDISLINPNPALIPELTGDVEIITTEKPSVLVVDKKFVTKKDGTYSVQTLVNGKPVTKPVSVGLINTKTIEITSGLNEGDEVVMLAK